MMRLSFLFILFLTSLWGLGQNRCGILASDPEHDLQFEDWMAEMKLRKSVFKSQGPSDIYTVPVVFHIIHNGEAQGFGENISEARILDQLDRLNEDFGKMNPRSPDVPTDFQPVEADIQIEFVLARQDPNGLPTNGIVRKQGTKSSYSFPGNDLKAESYWPSEDFLNIWVAETGNTIGWATFPETSLPGVNNPETNPERDGVVVDDDFIGTNLSTDGSFDSYGQTLTHEIGHFLGLKHIWGDSNCGNDYCDDTPEAQTHHGNNGSLPVESPCSYPGPDSCSGDSFADMFMNFMDYTNDECLSMFTEDQKFRMRTVMENSPRRLSLRTSPGLDPPIGILNRDMAFQDFESYSVVQCDGEASVTVNFSNFGSDEVTTFELDYTIGSSSSSITVDNINLQTGQVHPTEIELNNLSAGINTLNWTVTSVNGSTDENDLNNDGSLSITFDNKNVSAPIRQDFEMDSWVDASTSGESSWEFYEQGSNRARAVFAYNNATEFDSWLVSPVLSMQDMEDAGLFFDMAYGIPEVGSDQLDLMIQTGCGNQFEVFKSYVLANLDFLPNQGPYNPETNWLTEFVDLSAFAGESEIRLAFVFINRGGNNFYLDNIELTNNADPDQPRPEDNQIIVYPNPADRDFNVTVSFPEKKDVIVQLMDVTGSIVIEERYTAILNQTLRYESHDKAGIYFLRVLSQDFTKTKRILIRR